MKYEECYKTTEDYQRGYTYKVNGLIKTEEYNEYSEFRK